MPLIVLKTEIEASKEIVFDLSRSIDLHQISTKHTNEIAIEGRTSGLISLNETVTWRAKHFGIYQNLTSKITEYDSPNYFTDELVKGAFKEIKHKHLFQEINGITLMTDYFDYISPLGFLGKLADFLFLKKYMTRLLDNRNQIIKSYAETSNWKDVLQ